MKTQQELKELIVDTLVKQHARPVWSAATTILDLHFMVLLEIVARLDAIAEALGDRQ